LVVGDGTGGVFFNSGVAVPTAQNNTKSVYLRAVTGTATVQLKDAQQTIGTTTCNLTTNWQQFLLTETQSGGLARIWVSNIPASGIYIWGADLRPTSQATGLIGPTYQRVAAATVYDTAGFLPYLAFDGLSWSMGTNSIDFSAGDKVTAWAGVRKLSDAAQGAVLELSANAGTNSGTFYTLAPRTNAANQYVWYSHGSAAFAEANLTVASGYTAPITNVLTGIGDISGDVSTLRVNAIQAATNAADQGTGNYGNYPLYIGARNNTINFFNGWMYSLTVRGAQSSASEISAMESWVAGKTGVSL
jgi:hypothetical protein